MTFILNINLIWTYVVQPVSKLAGLQKWPRDRSLLLQECRREESVTVTQGLIPRSASTKNLLICQLLLSVFRFLESSSFDQKSMTFSRKDREVRLSSVCPSPGESSTAQLAPERSSKINYWSVPLSFQKGQKGTSGTFRSLYLSHFCLDLLTRSTFIILINPAVDGCFCCA